MNLPRETIYEALRRTLALTPGIAQVTRTLMTVDDVNAANLPVIVIDEPSEDAMPVRGIPNKWLLTVDLLVYSPKPPLDRPTYSTANQLLDAIGTVLAPGQLEPRVQTLGGAVQHCWLEGKIEKHGWLNDKVVVIVPVVMLTTD